MNLCIKEIADRFAQWTSPGTAPTKPLAGVCTDSRAIKAGELFVAIRGENFDGHRFVRSALQKGAAAALVDKSWFHEQADPRNAPLLVADDALTAYQDIARYYRKKLNPRVVALTGSAGKTTCKEFIYAVLAQKWRVLRNQKSFNNHVGVPATLLRLEPEHEILVAELGASGFGEIERLGELVEPDVCLLLNIGYAHLEFFKSLQGVTRAKMEIFAHAARDGVAVINADDEILARQDYPLPMLITFGVEQPSDVRAQKLHCDALGRYGFRLEGQEIQLSIPGRHNVYNAIAAAAIGKQFDVPMQDIKRALESVDFVEHRMNVTRVCDYIIIDDAYNANPGSCRAALTTLADMRIPHGARRIAVLGDMLELGPFSEKEHEKLADVAQQNGVDALFLYGDLSRATARRAAALGLSARHFENQDELVAELRTLAAPNDLILIKGSRSMHMERIIDALKDEETVG